MFEIKYFITPFLSDLALRIAPVVFIAAMSFFTYLLFKSTLMTDLEWLWTRGESLWQTF